MLHVLHSHSCLGLPEFNWHTGMLLACAAWQLDEGQKAVEALRAKQQENQAKLHECIAKLAVQTELALQVPLLFEAYMTAFMWVQQLAVWEHLGSSGRTDRVPRRDGALL
jgi:hypothetical protein